MFFLVLQLLMDLPVLLLDHDCHLLGADGSVYTDLQELHLEPGNSQEISPQVMHLREVVATICAAHRPSTRNLYHAKWQSFCRWCSQQEKDPLHPSVGMVLSYFQQLQQADLKHSTILSHISILRSCTNKVDGVPVGRHPLVAKWVLGDMGAW